MAEEKEWMEKDVEDIGQKWEKLTHKKKTVGGDGNSKMEALP